jgi:hypothetical protein
MSLASTYQQFILENIIKGYLYKKIIPDSDTLEADLANYNILHPDLSLPRSKFIDFSVEHGSSSSASLMNYISDTLADDIVVITREIYRLSKENSKYYERWLTELERLLLVAKKLENRSDTLLLLSNNTAGYFASVGDIFADMNLVDTTNTTVLVNVNEQVVSLNNGSEYSGAVSQINTTNMTESQVSFAPLSKRPGTSSFDVGTNNSLVQIFKTENTSWVGKIVTSNQGPMTAELKINLGKDFDISKISINSITPNSNYHTTITAQYSEDGYNWFLVPTPQATVPFNGNVSWNFIKKAMRWVKFIIHKTSSDTGQYEYIYAIRSIKFFADSFYPSRGDLFYSSSLYTTTTEDEIISFSKAQLDVCENIPTNTNIKYYLSASKDNSEWTNWYSVLPTTRDEVNYPKIINFGGIDWKDNNEDGEELNSSFDQNVLVTIFDNSDVDQYKFKNSTFAAVNTTIPIGSGEDQNPIANSIKVWRNIRNTEYYKVRDVLRGWHLDGQIYSCYFEVLDSNGMLLNFGDRECVIDGKPISGVITVPEGVHKFQTNADNWIDFSDDITGTITTETALAEIDPLYPYNHLFVIEGFNYPDSFDGEKIYTGTDLSAEFYGVRTSLFGIENNNLDYGYYAIHNIGTTDNILSIIVKYDSNNIDYTNEKFLIKWRAGESEASTYKYIKLKAEFDSDDSLITPTMSSYRIKLGI